MATYALLPLVILGLFSCRAVATADFLSRDAVVSAGAMIEADKNNLAVWNRHLLQILTPCPINFQTQNYTILLSQCKGPYYPAKECCEAFVMFACPFAQYLNDNSTSCSKEMFSYINVYGNYPPGLFAGECTNGTAGVGLPCPPSSQQTSDLSKAVRQESGYALLWLAVLAINAILVLSAS